MKKILFSTVFSMLTILNFTPQIDKNFHCQDLTKHLTTKSNLNGYSSWDVANTSSQAISTSNILSYHTNSNWITYDMSFLSKDYLGLKPAFVIDTNTGQLTIDNSKIDYSKLPPKVTQAEIDQQVDLIQNTKTNLSTMSNYTTGKNSNETGYYDDITGDENNKLLMFGAGEKPIKLTGPGAAQVKYYQAEYYQFGLFYIAQAVRETKINIDSGINLANQLLCNAFPNNASKLNFTIAVNAITDFVNFDACYNFINKLPYGEGYQYLANYLIIDKENEIIECGAIRFTYSDSYIKYESEWQTQLDVYLNFNDIWYLNIYGDFINYFETKIGFPSGFSNHYKDQVAAIAREDLSYLIITAEKSNNGAELQCHWFNDGITDGWEFENDFAWN